MTVGRAGGGSLGSGQLGGGADGGPIDNPRPGMLLRRNMLGPSWLFGYIVETLLRGLGSAGGGTCDAEAPFRLMLGRPTRLSGREDALGSGRGHVGGAVLGAREKFLAFCAERTALVRASSEFEGRSMRLGSDESV